jgi:uncharacterized OB-fold protein
MEEKSGKSRQVPAMEGLFTWPSDSPRLIGSRCKSCGTYSFPKFYDIHKPGCRHGEREEVLLSKSGILRSYTIQYYQPPPPFRGPQPFVPYAIGEVELPEGLLVIGIMTGCKLEDLKSSINVEMVVEKLYTDKEGNDVLTWKFRLA